MCELAGTVQSRSLNQVGAAGPAATATAATAPAATQPEPAAGTAKPAATKPAPSWVQRDGKFSNLHMQFHHLQVIRY